MAAQILISFFLILSIVASGLLLANAQKTDPSPASSPAATTQPADKSSKNQTSQASQEQKDNTPPKTSGGIDTKSTAKPAPLPILMELNSSRDFYHASDDIMVKAELWAIQPVTLCIYPEHPEANFAVDIYRAGFGKLDFIPNFVQLKREDMLNVDHVKLEPGQMHRILFNIKKIAPMPPAFWKTGEYRIQVKFYLCGKTEQEETAIPSQGPLHLLVLE